jgi:hypothetical protein
MTSYPRLAKIFTPERVVGIFLVIFITPLCGWVFDCGCTHLWAGAATHCNIHDASKPDCPWCVIPFQFNSLEKLSFFFTLLPAVIIYMMAWVAIKLARRYYGKNYWREMLAGFASLFLAFVAVAWIYKSVMGYPYFVF